MTHHRTGRLETKTKNRVEYCVSRTAKAVCELTKILWKPSRKSGGNLVGNPDALSQFENALVEFEPSALVPVR